jgi:hypothetical protein
MDFRPDPSLQAFRQEVREFLRESLPPTCRAAIWNSEVMRRPGQAHIAPHQ